MVLFGFCVGGWGLHNHFNVKPNYSWGCVEVEWGFDISPKSPFITELNLFLIWATSDLPPPWTCLRRACGKKTPSHSSVHLFPLTLCLPDLPVYLIHCQAPCLPMLCWNFFQSCEGRQSTSPCLNYLYRLPSWGALGSSGIYLQNGWFDLNRPSCHIISYPWIFFNLVTLPPLPLWGGHGPWW